MFTWSVSARPNLACTAVRNNGGGHADHTMFWQIMDPEAGGQPTGAIADALTSSFCGVDAFKEQFWKAGAAPSAAGGRG
jgi:superoxide dismutase, Fe-Mn family